MSAKKTARKPRTQSPSNKPGAGEYRIVLREGGGSTLVATAIDQVFYPQVLAWNRLLGSDRGLQTDRQKEEDVWRDNGRQAIIHLAKTGMVSQKEAEKFIVAAAASGIVQVESEWESEEIGWAARLFPWEAFLALATGEERKRIGRKEFLVVRVLAGGKRPTPPEGDPIFGHPGFAVSESAVLDAFDVGSEQAAIREALAGSLQPLAGRTLEELARDVAEKRPKIVHLVLSSRNGQVKFSPNDEELELPGRLARAVAAHGPEIAVFSACFTGRRLAPLAVAEGAGLALGFHGETMDASIPVFFGAFYRAWNHGADAIAALRAGLEANRTQALPADLGFITLWSAVKLIGTEETAQTTSHAVTEDTDVSSLRIGTEDLEAALPVICMLEETLNYSVLHNSRGGLFKAFAVTKVKPGKIDELEVCVRLDTGFDRPAECHFYTKLPPEADRQQDLAAGVTLPLGSQLLRQRGEILLGTVEVSIHCGERRIFHRLQSIKLLPCDEWRDDESGRHLLPSFVFPRDPAVREIISAAQPFLRALFDRPDAGFDGYQRGYSDDLKVGVEYQARAIWSALQYHWRLDYVSPPPAYTKASQRLRTPEEILRARRGTCIELSLLLASCWEHVGIFPVIFLTTGHAFAGYWSSETARVNFLKNLETLVKVCEDEAAPTPESAASEKCGAKAKEPWMFTGFHHLAVIRKEIGSGRLIAIETTYIPRQKPFAEAVETSWQMLMHEVTMDDPAGPRFDGMLDVRTARDKGVTPLAIIAHGVAS